MYTGIYLNATEINNVVVYTYVTITSFIRILLYTVYHV